jgi:diamine N-acetyltransferase
MIVLRPATEGSRVVLEPIAKATAATLGAGFAAIDPWARYPYQPALLAAYLAGREAGAPRYVVRVDGAVAGAIGYRDNWLRGPYLQFLGFLSPYQRQGIGRIALAWFEGTARARGDGNLWVAASAFNTAAIRFYEAHGFVRTAELEGLVRSGISEILLRKRLL